MSFDPPDFGGFSTVKFTDDEYSNCHAHVTENIRLLLNAFNQIKNMVQSIGTSYDSKRHREQLTGQLTRSTTLLKETQQTIKKLETLTSSSFISEKKTKS